MKMEDLWIAVNMNSKNLEKLCIIVNNNKEKYMKKLCIEKKCEDIEKIIEYLNRNNKCIEELCEEVDNKNKDLDEIFATMEKHITAMEEIINS